MAELSAEQQRLRSYLQAQAAKLPVPDIMAKVRADSARLREAAAAAEHADFTRRPAPGDWSVNDVLAHLEYSSRLVNASILAACLGAEQPAAISDGPAPHQQVRQPLEWVAALLADREDLFARLGDTDRNENARITWGHPMFGDLNWREWLLFLRLHDLDHAGQITGIVETLGQRSPTGE